MGDALLQWLDIEFDKAMRGVSTRTRNQGAQESVNAQDPDPFITTLLTEGHRGFAKAMQQVSWDLPSQYVVRQARVTTAQRYAEGRRADFLSRSPERQQRSIQLANVRNVRGYLEDQFSLTPEEAEEVASRAGH